MSRSPTRTVEYNATSAFLQRLAQLAGDARGFGGHECDVAVRGEEPRAFTDEFHLARNVAVAADAGDLAVFLRSRNHAIDRGKMERAAELSRVAQRRQEIVRSDVNHVDTFHRCN